MGFKRDLMCSVATFALFAYPAQAEDIFSGGELPAVSEFNAKLEGYGGFVEDDVDDGARAGAIGSFTMPLGHSLGFQIDGAIGDYAGETTGGVQGHLFLRDPASHLLGISAMYHAIGSNDIFRIGPEVEWYLDRFSLEFFGGIEESDSNNTEFFATGKLAYYLDDNLRFSIGYSRTIQFDVVEAGAEWMPTGFNFLAPTSVYVNFQAGDGDYASLWAGLRFYFGADPDKSLMRRHREDDPTPAFNSLTRQADDDDCPTVFTAETDEGFITSCTPFGPVMKDGIITDGDGPPA